MAWTRITQTIKGTFSAATFPQPSAYFHPEDLADLANQPGVIKIHYINATLAGQLCTVAIGVTEFDNNGIITLIDDIGDMIVLPCPPHAQGAGVRLTFP